MSRAGQKRTATALDDVADAIRNVGYCDNTSELRDVCKQLEAGVEVLREIATALERMPVQRPRDHDRADARKAELKLLFHPE